MAEKKIALAVGAHPDDVEFMMAGTLSLLAKAGYEPHIMTVANGSCGTAEYDIKQAAVVRRREARRAAKVMGATYHPGLVDDLMVYYTDRLVRRAAAVVREIRPGIVLLPSLEDYMEDHMNSARVMVTACFCRGMPNFKTIPARKPFMDDIALYHAQPYQNMDMMRRLIRPEIFVDVASEIEVKDDMLRCHESQKKWLDVSQGQDSYLQTMRDVCAEIARLGGRRRQVRYAEGFRRHNHIGFAAQDRDVLSEALGNKAYRGK